MRIAIISEESHVNSHKRALEAKGHDVVLLGGSPSKIPPTVDVTVLRTVGCSHGASDTAFAWSRAGGGHLIVEDGVSAMLKALDSHMGVSPPKLPDDEVGQSEMASLQVTAKLRMAESTTSHTDNGNLLVIGGRKSDLDIIDIAARYAGMRRSGCIPGTQSNIPESLVKAARALIVVENRTGSRLQQLSTELSEKYSVPLVSMDSRSYVPEMIMRLANAGFYPVCHLSEAKEGILRGRRLEDCTGEEKEALRYVLIGERAGECPYYPTATRRDRHVLLCRVVLAHPHFTDDEILLAALDVALHPHKLKETHPHHIDAARDEVGVICLDGVPFAVIGERMMEAAERHDVSDADLDALPWVVPVTSVETEPVVIATPDPIPEPIPENVMPTKTSDTKTSDSKPKKFQRVRSNGKPYSKPDEKFALCVEILRKHGDLSHARMVELLTERLASRGYVVPNRMNLPMASARIAAGIVAPVEPIQAPAPAPPPAPAPAPTLDERVRAAVVNLQALMREARIVSANLTPDSAALEVEVVTITHTTLRF